MTPPAASAAIRVGVTARGGRHAGGEGALADRMRERFQVRWGRRRNLKAFRVRLLYGCEPIVSYLAKSLDGVERAAAIAEDVGKAHMRCSAKLVLGRGCWPRTALFSRIMRLGGASVRSCSSSETVWRPVRPEQRPLVPKARR